MNSGPYARTDNYNFSMTVSFVHMNYIFDATLNQLQTILGRTLKFDVHHNMDLIKPGYQYDSLVTFETSGASKTLSARR